MIKFLLFYTNYGISNRKGIKYYINICSLKTILSRMLFFIQFNFHFFTISAKSKSNIENQFLDVFKDHKRGILMLLLKI